MPGKYIVKHDFSGKLLVDGDLQDNCILFRFLFDKPEMIHPLLVRIRVLPVLARKEQSRRRVKRNQNGFIYTCNVPDLNNPVMKSRLIYPDYLLKENRIQVINVESQVSCDFHLCSPVDVSDGKC